MHVSESGSRAQDLHVSLCAVLMAEACNIGLEPLIKYNILALTRHRLSWVKQNYLRNVRFRSIGLPNPVNLEWSSAICTGCINMAKTKNDK